MQIFRLIKYMAAVMAMSVAVTAAARSAAAWFTQAPAKVISGVPRNTRLDAIDYYRSGVARDVKTEQDVAVRITELTDQTVTMKRGAHTTIQLAVLPAGRDTMLAVVTTVDSPVKVSGLRFYDSQWKPLKQPPFTIPSFSGWLVDGAEADELQAVLGFIPVAATFSPEADSLILVNTGIDNARLNNVEESLRPLRAYNIKNAKFKPAE